MVAPRLRLAAACMIAGLALSSSNSPAAELVELSAENWAKYAPQGKEVDAIYGDYVLRNDKIVAVIARPVATRDANLTVRNVGGCLLDLTEVGQQNDQLSAFYPTAARSSFTSEKSIRVAASGGQPESPNGNAIQGKSVTWQCSSAKGAPAVLLRYSLSDGDPYVTVETTYTNQTDKPISFELVDAVRADRTFTMGADRATNLFWAADEWFQQAYGVVAEGHTLRRARTRGVLLTYEHEGAAKVTLAPGKSHTLVRKVFPARHTPGVKAIALALAGKSDLRAVELKVTDPAGPVEDARVTIRNGQAVFGVARTPRDGVLSLRLPPGKYPLSVTAVGRPETKQTLVVDAADGELAATVKLEACGYVAAKITDEQGRPIPCKVEFRGKDGATSPYWGPDSKAWGVHNVQYTHHGDFKAELGPGRYDVIISHGNEYDAVFTEIDVTRGETTPLAARLRRSVDTTGWISSDFHSHSSPSGDNTSMQLGRVLNLLAEHIEFAPCTEHNRISSYTPHLKKLGVEPLMATCTGIELTGSPLPINHQNAFPLVHKHHTQDGGGPHTHGDPLVQIERLALWDNNASKVVQGNHPNLVQMLGDRNLDGKPDGGFAKMFGFMDCIEIHPPQAILSPPKPGAKGAAARNRMFNWMQMLNLGYRLPGVVNTDAHYNHHGSGWLRNYIESPTDDPAKVKIEDIIHAVEHGHMVMTNGPFMEVKLRAKKSDQPAGGSAAAAGPGDDLSAPGGEATLHVRVQCPNWHDINRVQVFVNGKPEKTLNFTRRTHARMFADETVKFDQQVPLKLAADAHVIVAAAGEGLQLGPVMGPSRGKAMPIAVSNPIFVDVDGEGFKPNGDLLGVPLPLEMKPHKH